MMSHPKNIAVIGAGITGLVTALRLSSQGHRVTMLEASDQVGGLAGCMDWNGKSIDRYYHFICMGDVELVGLIEELELTKTLRWRRADTGCFIRGRIHPFNTPFDLLSFPEMPLSQRLRFGLFTAVSQHRRDWKKLDSIPAKQWLGEHIGAEAYNAIWDPLIRIKFGAFQNEVSAAWVWHRIHRVARSRRTPWGGNVYGYLEHGCQTLIDALLARLSEFDGFELQLNSPVDRIVVQDKRTSGVLLKSGQAVESDAVVSTCAIPQLLEMVDFETDHAAKLASIPYLHVLCLVLEMDRPFTGNFWLNVNDPDILFNGVVEITNLNPRPDLGGSRFAYVPFYLHATDPNWKMSDQMVYDRVMSALERIRADFRTSWIKSWRVERSVNAQAICRTGFIDIMPDYETPIRGLYMTDSTQYYPEDRTLSASVRLADGVSSVILRRPRPENDPRD